VQSAPPQASCVLKQFMSLDLNTEPDGRITIPLSVNGHPMQFMVDTGAVISVMGTSPANALGLRQSSLPYGNYLQFYDRVRLTKLVAPDSIVLGGASVHDWQFLVSPDFMLPGDASGLLGADVLRAFDVDIDYAHGKLNLFSPDHCPGQVVYWTKDARASVPMRPDPGWHITIPVTLDGQSLTAIVDTGAADSVMTYEEARDLFGWKDGDPRLKPLGPSQVNGADKNRAFRFPFATMTFEGIEVQNPDIVLVPRSTVVRGAPQLLLGASVLRQLHVYIAYGEKTLYLTGAEAK